MAGDAAFLHRVVREDKRALLRRVALRAGFVFPFHRGAGALDRLAFMRVVAVAAAHLAVFHLMAVRERKLAALVDVALEAGFGRLLRIDDGALAAAGLDVKTARPVTGLAARAADFRISGQGHLGVAGGAKVRDLFVVAFSASFVADVSGPRNLRWREHGAVHHHTRNEQKAPRRCASDDE